MSEEQKKAAEEVKTNEAPKAPEAKAKEEPKKEDAKPEAVAKATNCPVCNKSMKKKWYYRNNKYYCCKGCFQTDFKKIKEAKAQAAAGTEAKAPADTSAEPKK